jgi:hypothetical protein
LAASHLGLSAQLVDDGLKALQALGNLWLCGAVLTGVVAQTSIDASERLGMLSAPCINDADRIKQFRVLDTVKFPQHAPRTTDLAPGFEPATARPPATMMGYRSGDEARIHWVFCLPMLFSFAQFVPRFVPRTLVRDPDLPVIIRHL